MAFADADRHVSAPFAAKVLADARAQSLVAGLPRRRDAAPPDPAPGLRLVGAPPRLCGDGPARWSGPPAALRVAVSRHGAAAARAEAGQDPAELQVPADLPLPDADPQSDRDPAEQTAPVPAAPFAPGAVARRQTAPEERNASPVSEPARTSRPGAASIGAVAGPASDAHAAASPAEAAGRGWRVPAVAGALLAIAVAGAVGWTMLPQAAPPPSEQAAAVTPSGPQPLRTVDQAPEDARDFFRRALDVAIEDAPAAATFYARAAALGHGRAAAYLGQMYETGDGVPRNPALALAWYGRAAADEPAARARLLDIAVPPPPDILRPPRPVLAERAGRDRLDLVWMPADARTPASYVVELATDASRGPTQEATLTLSALRAELPADARLWRVGAASAGPEAASFTEWQPIPALPAAQ